MKFKHRGLRRLYEHGDSRRLAQSQVGLSLANVAWGQDIMPMYAPVHPGELIRESMNEVGWSVVRCAERLGISRDALSRLLNGRSSLSPRVALALERLGWSNAEFWMRVQAGYDLAQERHRQTAA